MSRQILILAKSINEANHYARLAKLPRFTYRSVGSAASIRGARMADIHILPGFLARPDRHSILSALTYTRGEVFYVDPADYEADKRLDLDAALEEAYPDPRGPLTDEVLNEAYIDHGDFLFGDFRQRYITGIEESDGNKAGTSEQSQDPAPDPTPKSKPAKPAKPKPESAAPVADFF